MRFIIFSGLDGSGKSTQLKQLKSHLESQGTSVAVFHAIEFSLANRLSRFFKGNKTFLPGHDRAITKASTVSIFLRKIFLAIDLVRFSFFRSSLERSGTDWLLADRSFYDSILNILFLSKDAENNSESTSKKLFLERFLPHPDHAIFFDITPEQIVKRDRVPEQGMDYLHRKAMLYKTKKKLWHFTEVNANQSPENVFKDVLHIVETKT